MHSRYTHRICNAHTTCTDAINRVSTPTLKSYRRCVHRLIAHKSYRRHNVASLQKINNFCTDDVHIVSTTLRINISPQTEHAPSLQPHPQIVETVRAPSNRTQMNCTDVTLWRLYKKSTIRHRRHNVASLPHNQ